MCSVSLQCRLLNNNVPMCRLMFHRPANSVGLTKDYRATGVHAHSIHRWINKKKTASAECLMLGRFPCYCVWQQLWRRKAVFRKMITQIKCKVWLTRVHQYQPWLISTGTLPFQVFASHLRCSIDFGAKPLSVRHIPAVVINWIISELDWVSPVCQMSWWYPGSTC